jgi:hypothetical protein
MSEVPPPDSADPPPGNQRHYLRVAVRAASAVVALEAYQGLVAVVSLLVPLPHFSLVRLDDPSGRQVQTAYVQIRHTLLLRRQGALQQPEQARRQRSHGKTRVRPLAERDKR